MEIRFKKLNHFWLDSGLAGLTIFLKDIASDIEISTDDSGVILTGEKEKIEAALKQAYDHLISSYYNLSTDKQKRETSNYNFYYDTKKDEFIGFPKRKTVGIASLIYDKAPRPSAGEVKWKKITKEVIINGKKKNLKRAILPESHQHLQERLDDFLDKGELQVTTAGLLLDGPNEIRPKVTINMKTSHNKGRCYLCGEESSRLEYMSQTTFPFITGSSGLLSFYTMTGKPEKACWKCSLLGKFVPVNAFYLTSQLGTNTLAFIPYSTSFEKMLEVYDVLQDMKIESPDLQCNFQHPLGFEKYPGGFYQNLYEVFFAFLFTLYKKVLSHGNEQNSNEPSFDYEAMFNLVLSKAPLSFVVIHTESLGNTYMGKTVWSFTESVYYFRLMKRLEENWIEIKSSMADLIESDKKKKNKTLTRNKVCERILKKKTILDLVETYVFHSDKTYLKNLVEFTFQYEKLIREGKNSMKPEEQEVAVKLGKFIGVSVGKEKGKKGDLFALRKSRKIEDFLNEINRLQFKFHLSVPKGLYEGGLNESNFNEFKQFCMIAALNSFYAATSDKEGDNLQ